MKKKKKDIYMSISEEVIDNKIVLSLTTDIQDISNSKYYDYFRNKTNVDDSLKLKIEEEVLNVFQYAFNIDELYTFIDYKEYEILVFDFDTNIGEPIFTITMEGNRVRRSECRLSDIFYNISDKIYDYFEKYFHEKEWRK